MDTYRHADCEIRHRSIEAVGRCAGYGLVARPRVDSWTEDGHWTTYEIAVATGPTRYGATPFRNVWVRKEKN